MTLFISIASLLLSTVIGIVFALARRSEILPLRYFGHIYVELVRGTPLLVQILVFFYVVADAFHVGNGYIVGVLFLSFLTAAYSGEFVRAGFETIGHPKLNSAKPIGLPRPQLYRSAIFPK